MKQLIRRLVYGPPPEEDRLIAEAARFPRYTPTTIAFRDLRIKVTDMLSVAWQIKEFFGDERMKLRSERPDPVIIDCGANVGISVFYLKKLFPAARITCYEPDKAVFACLEQNLRNNGITDVDCRREVVWVDDQGVSFGSEGADGGSVLRSANADVLPSVRLRDVLEQHAEIDLLKVDIEGAETTVLIDCGDALRRVRSLYVEYHSMPDRPQELHTLLAALAAHGFRYYIHRIGVYHRHPFAGLEQAEMDMQLDIHAIRR
jgi:FkbM family methyltransferase